MVVGRRWRISGLQSSFRYVDVYKIMMWYILHIYNFNVIKKRKKEVLALATAWVELEDTVLSEVSQSFSNWTPGGLCKVIDAGAWKTSMRRFWNRETRTFSYSEAGSSWSKL